MFKPDDSEGGIQVATVVTGKHTKGEMQIEYGNVGA
jgi:hypothetical protein